MSNKLESVTGIISISLAGFSVVLSPVDAKAWGDTLLQMAPLLLIVFLCWRIWVLDKHFKECRRAHDATAQQLLLAFTALQSSAVRRNLPDPAKIVDGEVIIEDIMAHANKGKNTET